jgi:TetR/AcrR family transcriptional repressor of uid operon
MVGPLKNDGIRSVTTRAARERPGFSRPRIIPSGDRLTIVKSDAYDPPGVPGERVRRAIVDGCAGGSAVGDHASEPAGRTADGGGRGLPGAPSAREKQRLLTHRRIVSAAISEFERVGVAHSRVEHICRTARVTRPTFYAHFPSKEDVVLELQRRAANAIADAVLSRLAEAATVVEVIDALVDGLFAAASSVSARLRREILSLDVRERRVGDWEGTALFRAVCSRFDAARRRGEIDGRHDAAQLARCVLVTLLGFLGGDAGDLESGRTDARAVLHLLALGLAAGRGTPP